MRQPTLLLALIAIAYTGMTVDARCHVTSHCSEDLLLKGTVLTSLGAQRRSSILLRFGKIECVNEDCESVATNATIIDCFNSIISPGFINTHEHIAYSTVEPLADIGERTNHRHDWRLGLRGFTKRDLPVNGSEINAIKWGELRHLFSGTTSIVGGMMTLGLTRNLDFVDGLQDGLTAPASYWDVFPLDDTDGDLRNGDCDYGSSPMTRAAASKFNRYIAHIADGIDAEAENEFRCISNITFDTQPAPRGGGLSTDLVGPNLVIVQGVGLTENDFDMVAARGAKVVWSPRSNVFLYGKTLNVTYLLEAGITVALGTDWLPSGSATMSREAICGLSVMRKSYGITLDPKTIWEMMTINAANVAGFERRIGSLEEGKLADITVVGGRASEFSAYGKSSPFAQAIFSPPEHIELVIRAGKILLSTESIKDLVGSCEKLAFGNTTKYACIANELGSSFRDFETSLGGVYPAILPGVPPREPTCEPTR
ncbi:metal dependent amidohydrolase [Boeremia exigua]|uniref:metal dependent amidohydrolase n=1 Tax=Boeremia exigua TaxID=749465 RepID=UPI001E8D6763|nr:metal dependent amidohydrolase [Boeremia exigua]KAH6613839.1 metal dependent amidohydrolase [Boeremia exigua]